MPFSVPRHLQGRRGHALHVNVACGAIPAGRQWLAEDLSIRWIDDQPGARGVGQIEFCGLEASHDIRGLGGQNSLADEREDLVSYHVLQNGHGRGIAGIDDVDVQLARGSDVGRAETPFGGPKLVGDDDALCTHG